MRRMAWLLMIPFALMFILGLALRVRPQYPVQVIEVLDSFSRQEKTSPRGSHRRTVYYANVRVELDGEIATVTVHDPTWEPLKPGDRVVVTRNLFGKVVEYTSADAYRLMGAAAMGPVCLLLYLVIARRKARDPNPPE